MHDIKQNKPKKTGNWWQGYYTPKNPEKYVGDITKIIYRSSWEYRFCRYCDDNQAVVRWSSEPFPIKYISPIDGREHRYFVDFYMRAIRDGVERDFLVEIKPENALKKPEFTGKATMKRIASYNEAARTWLINCAKFAAAKNYCEMIGYRFVVITQEFLFKEYEAASKGK